MCDLALFLVSLSILQHGAVVVFLSLSVGSLEVDLVCWCNLLKINKSTTAAAAAAAATTTTTISDVPENVLYPSPRPIQTCILPRYTCIGTP